MCAAKTCGQVKLNWIKDYHGPDDHKGSVSGADMRGNCTRCGDKLGNHEDQIAHNNKKHLR